MRRTNRGWCSSSSSGGAAGDRAPTFIKSCALSSCLHQIARSTSLLRPPFSTLRAEAFLRVRIMRRSSPARPPRAAEAASPPSGRLPLKAEHEPIASRFLALKRALNSA
jgi:hypothetical protein